MKSTLGNKSYTIRDLIPLSHSLHWTAVPSLHGNKVNTGLANSPGEQKHCWLLHVGPRPVPVLVHHLSTHVLQCCCYLGLSQLNSISLRDIWKVLEKGFGFKSVPQVYSESFLSICKGSTRETAPSGFLVQKKAKLSKSFQLKFFKEKKKIQQHWNLLWTDTCSDTVSILFKNLINIYSYFRKYSSYILSFKDQFISF